MSVDDKGPKTPSERAAALRRWAQQKGYGDKKLANTTSQERVENPTDDEPLAPDTKEQPLPGEALQTSPPSESAGVSEVSGASGSVRSGQNDAMASAGSGDLDAAEPLDSPLVDLVGPGTQQSPVEGSEFANAKNRGKNNDGEKMKDVVFIMTETEMKELASDMAHLQRTYGTRNLPTTLLRATRDAQRYIDLRK